MNVITNFCSGECTLVWQPEAGKFDPNNPLYKINNQGSSLALNAKTLDMDSIHYGPLLEYDVHNLYDKCIECYDHFWVCNTV